MGCGVGSGVFSSTVGGWSPLTGDSSVGRVENMPGGAVGVAADSSPESLQASIASANAAIPIQTMKLFCDRRLLSIPKFIARCIFLDSPLGFRFTASGVLSGACGQENLENVSVTLLDSTAEGGVAEGVGDVDVGTGLSQNSHHFAIAL